MTIDIIRRDTLAATITVPSPLQALGPDRGTGERNLPPKAARHLAALDGGRRT